MRAKLHERNQAIALRRQGLSYSEIRRRVPVAKSSLSDWLRQVGLLEWQQRRLSERKLASGRRGAQILHERRLQRAAETLADAGVEAQRFLEDRVTEWVIGAVLYWAEGSKIKPWNPAAQLTFTNMDPEMILFMRLWLERYCSVKSDDIGYALLIHEGADASAAEQFWLKKLAIDHKNLRTYFKRHNPSPKRKNTGRDYHGIMRLRVKKSSALNLRIAGWIRALGEYCGVV